LVPLGEEKINRREYLKYFGGAAALAIAGAAAYGTYKYLLTPKGELLIITETPSESPTETPKGGEFMVKKFELPDLPYEYDALEPIISEEILRLHHDKHHLGYVNGANAALDKLETGRASGFKDVDIRAVERDLSFNVSGHILHTLYWQNMSPNGGGTPSGKLADLINESFGSFEKFKNQLSGVAKNVEGSGWGLLIYEPISERLMVLQIQNHQNLAVHGGLPILTVDVWEHAYYLQYKNDRGSYVDKWWDLINWEDVAKRVP
jgi:Fe-Mn family superoxide dismutase